MTSNENARQGLNEVVIASFARTPIGGFRGSLATLPATELGAIAIKGAVLTCSRYQRSSYSRGPLAVKAKDMTEVVVAGGMESMSNAPYYMKRGETPYGSIEMQDGILINGLTDAFHEIHMGACAEHTARKYGVTREQQDDFGVESYKKATAAAKDGVLSREIVPIAIPGKPDKPAVLVHEDHEYKRANFDKLRTIPPAFDKEAGTITAANASKLSDGAAACVLMTRQAADRLGLKPIARIVDFADAALEPLHFCVAPAHAIHKVFNQSGLKMEDMSLVEINEAFSAAVLCNMKHLSLDGSKVNIQGGAVNLGHPLWMSGARIAGRLVLHLQPGQYGLACVCNGGGGASAILIERL